MPFCERSYRVGGSVIQRLRDAKQRSLEGAWFNQAPRDESSINGPEERA